MSNNKNTRLNEEEFLSEKGPSRDFAKDAKTLTSNKRSQKGIGRLFGKKRSIFSSF